MIDINIKKRMKTYNGFRLLHIKRSFAAHSITQVLGPSGAGKTTFLKILAGLIQPDEGSITVRDETWFDANSAICVPAQKRNIGFVFQDYALFPNMTVEQHLSYGTHDNQYIRQLLEIGRMETFSKHKPRQLSGGQQQRLAILRALATKPRILLMDEPFSALDNDLKSGIIFELKHLLQELTITCLVVTHQAFKPGEFSDHSFLLD